MLDTGANVQDELRHSLLYQVVHLVPVRRREPGSEPGSATALAAVAAAAVVATREGAAWALGELGSGLDLCGGGVGAALRRLLDQGLAPARDAREGIVDGHGPPDHVGSLLKDIRMITILAQLV